MACIAWSGAVLRYKDEDTSTMCEPIGFRAKEFTVQVIMGLIGLEVA